MAGKSSRFDICGTLFYGLIKNHCFYDANKRTAFLSLLFHLEKLGYCPTVSQKDLEDFAVQVAENSLSRYARYREFQKDGDSDPNVRFVSDYISRNSRKIDTEDHVITYRDLETILKRRGFFVETPGGNSIDIGRYSERSTFLGFGPKRQVRDRVGTAGFHGWSKQVSKSDIKKIRKMTGLEYKDGVDSASFFGKLDSMRSLMTSYQEPLRRLANR